MCYQIVEIYKPCRCLYYQHAVTRCAAYGRPGHKIRTKTVLVNSVCRNYPHSRPNSQDGGRTFAVERNPTLLPSSVQSGPDDGEPRDSGEEGSRPFAVEKNLISVPSSVQPGPDDGEPQDPDEENVISTASSAPTVDGDTVGLLFSKLQQFGHLRYLWPQLIARSSTWDRSQSTVERLLHRYSEDLHRLALGETCNEPTSAAEKALQIKVSKLVRRARRSIARRICHAHYLSFEPSGGESTESYDEPRNLELEDSSEDAPDDDLSFRFMLETADAFLFHTEPILHLQASLRLLVKLREPGPSPWMTRAWSHTKMVFENTCHLLQSRFVRLQSGTENATRLQWTCVCGKNLFDDFKGFRPEALAELHELLQGYGKPGAVANDLEPFDNQSRQERSRQWRQTLSRALGGCARLFSSAKPSQWLPQRRQDEQAARIGVCFQLGTTSGPNSHDFVLLCIPFMRLATKLYQPEVCRINSDQQFLQLLRHYYQTKRGSSPWKWIRKVKSINFVKLEVYRNHLADIRSCPSVPPPEKIGTEYAFEICHSQHTDVAPPIGPNLLAHLFEHPDHADIVPTIWNRIPRKLTAQLTACPIAGSSLGWGLQIVEGLEWFVFFILGCVGFLACLLVAVVWSATRDDVQGGFTIGGFLLAFLIFCGEIVHLAVSE